MLCTSGQVHEHVVLHDDMEMKLAHVLRPFCKGFIGLQELRCKC